MYSECESVPHARHRLMWNVAHKLGGANPLFSLLLHCHKTSSECVRVYVLCCDNCVRTVHTNGKWAGPNCEYRNDTGIRVVYSILYIAPFVSISLSLAYTLSTAVVYILTSSRARTLKRVSLIYTLVRLSHYPTTMRIKHTRKHSVSYTDTQHRRWRHRRGTGMVCVDIWPASI